MSSKYGELGQMFAIDYFTWSSHSICCCLGAFQMRIFLSSPVYLSSGHVVLALIFLKGLCQVDALLPRHYLILNQLAVCRFIYEFFVSQ